MPHFCWGGVPEKRHTQKTPRFVQGTQRKETWALRSAKSFSLLVSYMEVQPHPKLKGAQPDGSGDTKVKPQKTPPDPLHGV